MICQIIDSVDNHFCEYLWYFLAVRLYSWHNNKEPANCKLIQEIVFRLNGGRPVNKPAPAVVLWKYFIEV